jgi:peptide/nickel transport system permease protein
VLVYTLKRLGYVAVILAVMSVLIFWATQVMPGDVAQMIVGQFATEEQIRAVRAKMGLDDPIHVQYLRWAGGLLRGDFGLSLMMDRPIAPLIGEAMQRSAVLAGISIVLVAALGIWLGVYSAVRRGTAADHAISLGSYFFISVPEFFWAIVVILLFTGYLGWLPATGYAPLSDGFWQWLQHILLPVATLVSGLVAHVSRLTRSSMIETMQSQYVTAARAKGLPESLVIRRHALRNALVPTITVLAIDVGLLMGGIVVVETVFSYPGLGRMLIFAIEQKDIPMVQAGILAVTAVYAIANLAADLLYAFFNPRIRYGRAAAQ